MIRRLSNFANTIPQLNPNPNNTNHTVSALLSWFARNARDLPWRRTCEPYAVWISEIMLQQTQVKTVIPYWERWMEALPDVAALAGARTDKVLKLWEGLGYYSRARNAQAAAKLILEQHGGVFPSSMDAVLALPGIGRYTAGAICSIAFNQPVPILDGNVARVLSRLFAVSGPIKENPARERLWELAARWVETSASLPDARLAGVSDCALQIAENAPFDSAKLARLTGRSSVFSGNCSMLNQALMELGALVCTPREPDCAACPLRDHCAARIKGQVSRFPEISQRAAVVKRRVAAMVVKRGKQYLIRQRPAGGVNGGFWEFPNFEIGQEPLAETIRPFELLDEKPLVQFFHSITHHRILLQAFHAKCPVAEGGIWKTAAQLRKLPFTGAHRKIVHLLT